MSELYDANSASNLRRRSCSLSLIRNASCRNGASNPYVSGTSESVRGSALHPARMRALAAHPIRLAHNDRAAPDHRRRRPLSHPLGARRRGRVPARRPVGRREGGLGDHHADPAVHRAALLHADPPVGRADRTEHAALIGLPPRFLRRLGAGFRLIVFDRRGTGLSDRVPDDELPSLEGRMDDTRAVLDAAGSEQAAIFAQGYGTPLATIFAATYPERTRALVL